MKKIIYIPLAVFGLLILLFCVWFFYLRFERERQLMREGDILIERIEKFRTEHSRLPNSFKEMGIEETGLMGGCCGEGADLLYYDKIDSLHYIVSFGMSIDYNRTYYSENKQWRDFNDVILQK